MRQDIIIYLLKRKNSLILLGFLAILCGCGPSLRPGEVIFKSTSGEILRGYEKGNIAYLTDSRGFKYQMINDGSGFIKLEESSGQKSRVGVIDMGYSQE